MSSKQIAQERKKVIAQEREARPIRGNYHAKVVMNRDPRAPVHMFATHVVGLGHDAAAVAQQHLARLHQTLEHAGDVEWRLVRFVHEQDGAVPNRLDEGRVLVVDAAGPDHGLHAQRVDRGVAVQLDVLAGLPGQHQELVDELVFAGA